LDFAPRLRDTLSRGFWIEKEMLALRTGRAERAPAASGWECRASEKGRFIARIEILQWSGLRNG
jgi:hypothetical protein